MKILALSSGEVLASCDMARSIEAMRAAFALHGRGKVQTPLRTRMNVEGRRNVLVMAASSQSPGRPITVKVVSVYPDAGPGSDATNATVMLLSGNDGRAKAILEGGALTAIRTGAVSGLSCRYLARRDSKVLGIFGAGGQAFHQVAGVHAAGGLALVKVYSRHRSRSRALANRTERELGLETEVCETPGSCSLGSDIVVTATTSPRPILSRRMVDDGTHVIAIGAYTPDTRELDTSLVAASSVFADSREAVLAEAGDILIPIREGRIRERHVRGDLAELVLGRKRGRRSRDEVTLFKSVGLAFEDTALAQLAYSEARRRRRGRWIDLR